MQNLDFLRLCHHCRPEAYSYNTGENGFILMKPNQKELKEILSGGCVLAQLFDC
jgi:hypothetical protein